MKFFVPAILLVVAVVAFVTAGSSESKECTQGACCKGWLTLPFDVLMLLIAKPFPV